MTDDEREIKQAERDTNPARLALIADALRVAGNTEGVLILKPLPVDAIAETLRARRITAAIDAIVASGRKITGEDIDRISADNPRVTT